MGIRKTTNYGVTLSINVTHTVVENIQVGTGANTSALADGGAITYRNCIFSSASNSRCVSSTGSNGTYINCVLIVEDGAAAGADAIRAQYTNPTMINCSLVTLFPSSTGFGFDKGSGSDSSVLKNCAVFGFGTALETGTYGVSTDYNGTDDSALPTGSNNQTSLTIGDQFENVSSDAAADWRLKSGNSLDSNGTPDALTNDLDIFGNTRDATNPSIGAYETVSSGITVTPDPLSNLQTLSNVTLTQQHVFAVDNISTLQTISSPSLTQQNILSVSDLETDKTISNVSLSVGGALAVNDLSQLQTLSNVTLSVEGVLSVDSILSEQTLSNSSLITQVALLTDNITNQQFISVVSFDEGQDIGTVTAAFKESGISVNYGLAQFTVKFKE